MFPEKGEGKGDIFYWGGTKDETLSDETDINIILHDMSLWSISVTISTTVFLKS